MHIDVNTEQLGVKAIEKQLSYEISNWLAYVRMTDYKPASVKCLIGRLYIRPRIPEGDDRYDPFYKPRVKPNEKEAMAFETLVVTLPKRHCDAFVAYHLDKAAVDGHIVRITDRDGKARALGLAKSQYHIIVLQAHRTILQHFTKADNDEKAA